MRNVILFLLFPLLTCPCFATQTFRLKPVIVEGNDVKIEFQAGSLYIQAPAGKLARIQLLKIISPLISQPQYSVAGAIAYSEVKGEGYLEMWSDFGTKGRFFSRTLATSGLMAHIVGDSGIIPRDFSLIFDTSGKMPAPRELEINLILPEGGIVSFNPGVIQLQEITPPLTRTSSIDPKTENILTYGALVLGGILGLSTGLLAFRNPQAALICARTALVLGAILLVAGLVVPWFGQPVAVAYRLLLTGVLITIFSTALLWYVARLRRKNELRRMVAMDLG